MSTTLYPFATSYSDTLAADTLVDIGVVIINWSMLADLKSRNVDARKKRLVLLGFSSSICTLIVNVAFWALYFLYVPEKPMLFLCLANAVVRNNTIWIIPFFHLLSPGYNIRNFVPHIGDSGSRRTNSLR